MWFELSGKFVLSKLEALGKFGPYLYLVAREFQLHVSCMVHAYLDNIIFGPESLNAYCIYFNPLMIIGVTMKLSSASLFR